MSSTPKKCTVVIVYDFSSLIKFYNDYVSPNKGYIITCDAIILGKILAINLG